MAFSLYPAFVRIAYHSSYAPHLMTLPTTAYDGDSSGQTAGNFQTWAGGSIAADDMVEALVDVLAPMFPSSVEFDSFKIFTMASDTADPLPAYSQVLTQVGSAAGNVWNKAVEKTITANTLSFNIAKLVLLDAATNGTFDLVTASGVNAFLDAIVTEWTATTNGWAGRDSSRPATFLQMSTTLNEKLRRAYRLQ